VKETREDIEKKIKIVLDRMQCIESVKNKKRLWLIDKRDNLQSVVNGINQMLDRFAVEIDLSFIEELLSLDEKLEEVSGKNFNHICRH